jgi:hypothetical protein
MYSDARRLMGLIKIVNIGKGYLYLKEIGLSSDKLHYHVSKW